MAEQQFQSIRVLFQMIIKMRYHHPDQLPQITLEIHADIIYLYELWIENQNEFYQINIHIVIGRRTNENSSLHETDEAPECV